MKGAGVPRVAIVIPCHDDAVLLSKTLAGIAAQGDSLSDVEVIVIDNNSSVDSIEAVHRAYIDMLELTLIQQPRLSHPFSLCRARNTALRMTEADWIVSLDADCIPAEGYIGAVLRRIGEAGDPRIYTGERSFVSCSEISASEILVGVPILSGLPTVPSVSNYGLHRDRRMPGMARLPDVSHPWAFMHACSLLYQASVARRIGGHDEAFDGHWGYEDADFAYRMITTGGCEPRFAPEMRVYHQEPGDGVTGRYQYKSDKAQNPNWTRICAEIMGFREFKRKQFQELGVTVNL